MEKIGVLEKKVLELNKEGIEKLIAIVKFAYPMAIFGLGIIGITFCIALYFLFDEEPNNWGSLVAVIMFMFIFLMFFPLYYLYRFSISLKKALEDSDSNMLLISLRYLELCFKSIGVILIVSLLANLL